MLTIVKRALEAEQRSSLIELIVILSMTSVLFYLLETNMLVFGLFVYAGLIWVVRDAPNYKLGMVTGAVGGIVGFATEYWGCARHYWNWVIPCKSIWMVNGMEDGFPVEVVIAYAGAGFWMTKLSLKMFAKEHAESAEFFRQKRYLTSFSPRFALALITALVGVTVICIEPAFLQSTLIFMFGVSVSAFLPRSALGVVLPFSAVVGVVGFFFENFATGFFSSFAVWRYNLSAYADVRIPNPIIGVAPITAFIAYVGVGLLLFGLSFLLNHALTEETRSQ